MKNPLLKFTITLILFWAGATITGLSQTKKEANFVVSVGDLLEVSIRQGDIKIFTGSGNEVNLIAKNIEQDEVSLLTMEQKQGKVEVKFKGEDSDKFELELRIPESMNLDFSTGGGNISVKGDLKGLVDGSTGGGNISAENIFGKTEFSTAGGLGYGEYAG